jgi:DNA-binding LytR/AlgR family response regulator
MIRIAIVDNEESSITLLRKCLETYAKAEGTAYEITGFLSGMDFITEYDHSFDLVFMDIEMPLLDGLQTAKKLRKIDETVAIVFVTNMAQYAINGYEVNALDYIVKPVEYHTFRMKFARILRYLASHKEKNITLNTTNKGIVRLHSSDIYYFEGDKHYINVHTRHGDFVIRSSMKEAEETYRDYGFARCSTSYLVNLRLIERLETNGVFIGEKEFPLTRTKKTEFLNCLSAYYAGEI